MFAGLFVVKKWAAFDIFHIVLCDDYNKTAQLETHQDHVTGWDVHIWVGGLFAPGGNAAPCRGADGLTAIAELRRDAVDPGGDGLRTLGWGLDSHALPTQLLREGRRYRLVTAVT